MTYLQRPFGVSKQEESFSRDLSFSRAGSSSGLNTSSARFGRTNQEFQGNFTSFRQNLREQVTNNFQNPLRQGSPYGTKTSGTESYGKYFSSNRNSEQKNVFSSPRETLTVSTNKNNKLFQPTATTGDGFAFKKRIADSVASRLSPGKLHAEDSPLMVKKRKSIREEPPAGVHSDIWGLKMTNPTNLTLSTNSPLRSKFGTNMPSSNSAIGFQQKPDLNSNFDALNRIRKSSTREHTTAISKPIISQETPSSSKLSFGSVLFTGGTSASNPSGGGALLSLKEELTRKKLIASPTSKQREVADARPSNIGAASRLRPESNNKTARDKTPESKLHVPLKTPELRLPESLGTKEESKSNQNQLFSSLSQELEKIRSESLLNPTSKTISPRSNVMDRIGALSRNVFSNSTQEERSEIDPETPSRGQKYQPKQVELRKQPFTEVISLKRLYEMQSVLTEVSENEFNELPSSYIEEMIKLSEVINDRVKSSNYSRKKD